MLEKVRRAFYKTSILALMLGLLPHSIAQAAVSCTANITPTQLAPGEVSVLQYDLQNTGDQDIRWIHIQRPTVSYAINGITQAGWTDATTDEGTILDHGTLATGDTYSLQLAMFTAPQDEPASAWTVEVSASSDGSNPYSCTGSISTSIAAPDVPPEPNGMSNIGVISITHTTATITWTSDVAATTYLYYGPDTGYGQIATTPGMDTEHRITLTGLTPSTVYHYKVAGTDTDGNNLFSEDQIFSTPAAPPVVTPNPTPVPTNKPGATPAPTIKPVPTEKIPPTVSLTTDLSAPFTAAPKIYGVATDNEAVARIEYSTDGGQNWLPIDRSIAQGTTSKIVNFSFTPTITDDGNYAILARAIDTSSNTATTAPATLVIDRLAPQIGPIMITSGPTPIPVDHQGVVDLLAGTSYSLSTSAIGGATSVTLEAIPQEQLDTTKTIITLTQNLDSGLWEGAINLTNAGIYQLVARSLDGAGNKTSRNMLTATVTPTGRVIDAVTMRAIPDARVTVYYLEPITNTWSTWDGAPYAQVNPQTPRSDGSYNFLLPPGKYYVEISAPRHHAFLSDVFSVALPTAITSIVALRAIPHITVFGRTLYGPDIVWRSQRLPDSSLKPIAGAMGPGLIGKPLPSFSLPTTDGGQKTSLSLEGKPTVITLLTTWSPEAQAQLGDLAKAQGNHDVNVTPIFVQERTNLVSSHLAIAGSKLMALVDADGVTVAPLQVNALPRHIFVDRTGHVKKVMLGVLSKEQLINELGGL